MADISIYDAKDVQLTVNGRVIQGFQENDMFSAKYKEDRVKTTVDAQGQASIAKNNARLGQIVVNLSGNSADHKLLNQLANTNEIFQVSAITPIEKISGNQAIIAKPADSAYGKNVPARTYTIEVLDMNMEVI